MHLKNYKKNCTVFENDCELFEQQTDYKTVLIIITIENNSLITM